jgi:hypothetical protein
MAFVLPILVVLFCAVVHFGILFYLQIGMEQAVREGALFGAYHPQSDTTIRNMVLLSLPALVDTDQLTLDVKTDGSRSIGDELRIQIDYKIQILEAIWRHPARSDRDSCDHQGAHRGHRSVGGPFRSWHSAAT